MISWAEFRDLRAKKEKGGGRGKNGILRTKNHPILRLEFMMKISKIANRKSCCSVAEHVLGMQKALGSTVHMSS